MTLPEVLDLLKSYAPLAGVAVWLVIGGKWLARYEATTKKLDGAIAKLDAISSFVEQSDKKISTLSNAHATSRRQSDRDRVEHNERHARERNEHIEEHRGINGTLKDLLQATGEVRGKVDSFHEH